MCKVWSLYPAYLPANVSKKGGGARNIRKSEKSKIKRYFQNKQKRERIRERALKNIFYAKNTINSNGERMAIEGVRR